MRRSSRVWRDMAAVCFVPVQLRLYETEKNVRSCVPLPFWPCVMPDVGYRSASGSSAGPLAGGRDKQDQQAHQGSSTVAAFCFETTEGCPFGSCENHVRNAHASKLGLQPSNYWLMLCDIHRQEVCDIGELYKRPIRATQPHAAACTL